LDARDVGMCIRYVGVMSSFQHSMAALPPPLADLDFHDYWLEFGRLCEDIVVHLAITARQGFHRKSQNLCEVLALLNAMLLIFVKDLLLRLCPEAAGK